MILGMWQHLHSFADLFGTEYVQEGTFMLEKILCRGKVMYLSVELGICSQAQYSFFPLYIPNILLFMSVNHRASMRGICGSQGLSPAAPGMCPTTLWTSMPGSVGAQERCMQHCTPLNGDSDGVA